MKALFRNRTACSPVTRLLPLSQRAPGPGMANSHGPAVREQDLPWGAFAFLSSLLLEVDWGPLTLWSRSSVAGSGGRRWIDSPAGGVHCWSIRGRGQGLGVSRLEECLDQTVKRPAK